MALELRQSKLILIRCRVRQSLHKALAGGGLSLNPAGATDGAGRPGRLASRALASRLEAQGRKRDDEASAPHARVMRAPTRPMARLDAPIAHLRRQLHARGKGRMHPNIGEIGPALRRLGYVQA